MATVARSSFIGTLTRPVSMMFPTMKTMAPATNDSAARPSRPDERPGRSDRGPVGSGRRRERTPRCGPTRSSPAWPRWRPGDRHCRGPTWWCRPRHRRFRRSRRRRRLTCSPTHGAGRPGQFSTPFFAAPSSAPSSWFGWPNGCCSLVVIESVHWSSSTSLNSTSDRDRRRRPLGSDPVAARPSTTLDLDVTG